MDEINKRTVADVLRSYHANSYVMSCYINKDALNAAIHRDFLILCEAIEEQKRAYELGLELIAEMANVQIPLYAYGGNQAACEMAAVLNDIQKIAFGYLVEQPKEELNDSSNAESCVDSNNNI